MTAIPKYKALPTTSIFSVSALPLAGLFEGVGVTDKERVVWMSEAEHIEEPDTVVVAVTVVVLILMSGVLLTEGQTVAV